MDRQVADVCVVGSGFAGTFVALQTAAAGMRTVLLEAGPSVGDGRAAGASDLLPTDSSGDADFGVDDNRCIALGGTSRRWNGVITRMLPEDFRTASLYGLFADWPLGANDLGPYYDQAEALLGVAGAGFRCGCEPPRAAYPIARSWAIDIDPTLTPLDATASFPLAFALQDSGEPLRLHSAILPQLEQGAAIRILTDSVAQRIVVDAGGVIGVEVRKPDGSIAIINARSVVIAAGTVETPRLLLASRSPLHPHGLGNEHDLVGRYLNSHPRYRFRVRGAECLRPSQGVLRSYRFAAELRRRRLGALAVDWNLFEAEPTVDITMEMEPDRNNRVRLDSLGHDRWGNPRLVVESSFTDMDRRTAREVQRLARDFVAQVSDRACLVEEPLRWFHPAGTCRMAADPQHGVVDASGAVFGVPNLYVAGSAVFPTSGPTNPTLTVVALALRLGNHLVQRFRRGSLTPASPP